ncbi:hypothetical protein M3P05_19260 [Sansalvadorimonas sp. 2012CJ34-2]|uniref:Uncharacterized protein n=1 Tax=Parendozoicomonas callyspongiae TaxID=2942213 RepID=A0ABT0PKZ5_9GAMM|nr:hypothetical protein [Sansalvadorimonas sp. 2012CJ34-2]MCL6272064.1 hypothetical protein [Sansalvadorimonas sp. 2012CJ34-2]
MNIWPARPPKPHIDIDEGGRKTASADATIKQQGALQEESLQSGSPFSIEDKKITERQLQIGADPSTSLSVTKQPVFYRSFADLASAQEYEPKYFKDIQNLIERWRKHNDANSCEELSLYLKEYAKLCHFLFTNQLSTSQHLKTYGKNVEEILHKLPRPILEAAPPFIHTLRGIAVLKKNRNKAEENFKSGFAKGDGESALWLGMLSLRSNPDQAIEAFQLACNEGLENAAYWFKLAIGRKASCSFKKLGWYTGEKLSDVDRKRCEDEAIEAAKNGEFTFLARVADSYINGTRGYPEDKKKGFFYLEQAIQQNNPAAQLMKAVYLSGVNYLSSWRVKKSQPMEALELFLLARKSHQELVKKTQPCKVVMQILKEDISHPASEWIATIYNFACEQRKKNHALAANLLELFSITPDAGAKREKVLRYLEKDGHPENRFWLAAAMADESDANLAEALIMATISFHDGFPPATTLLSHLYEKEENNENNVLACSHYMGAQQMKQLDIEPEFNIISTVRCFWRLGMLDKADYVFMSCPNISWDKNPEGCFVKFVASSIASDWEPFDGLDMAISKGSYRAHIWKLRKELSNFHRGEMEKTIQFREEMKECLLTDEAKILELAFQSHEFQQKLTIPAGYCDSPRCAFRALDLYESGFIKLDRGVTPMDLIKTLLSDLSDEECYLLRRDPGAVNVISAIIKEMDDALISMNSHNRQRGYHLAACLSCDPDHHIKEAECLIDMGRLDFAWKTIQRARCEYESKCSRQQEIQKIFMDLSCENSQVWQEVDELARTKTNRIKIEMEHLETLIKSRQSECLEDFPLDIPSENLIEELKKALPATDLELDSDEGKAVQTLKGLVVYLPAITFDEKIAQINPAESDDETVQVLGRYFYNLGVAHCRLKNHPKAYHYIDFAMKYKFEKAGELAWKYYYFFHDFTKAIKCLEGISPDVLQKKIADSFKTDAYCMQVSLSPWTRGHTEGGQEIQQHEGGCVIQAKKACELGSGYGYATLADYFACALESTKLNKEDHLKYTQQLQVFTDNAVQMRSTTVMKSILNGFLSGEPKVYPINAWRLICAFRACPLPSLSRGEINQFCPTILTPDTDVAELGSAENASMDIQALYYMLQNLDSDSHAILYLWLKTGQLKENAFDVESLLLSTEKKNLIEFLARIINEKKCSDEDLKKHTAQMSPKLKDLVNLTLAQLSVIGAVEAGSMILNKRKDILKKAAQDGYICAYTYLGLMERYTGNKLSAIGTYEKTVAGKEASFLAGDTDVAYLYAQALLTDLGPSETHFQNAKIALEYAMNGAHTGAAALYVRLSTKYKSFGSPELSAIFDFGEDTAPCFLVKLWAVILNSGGQLQKVHQSVIEIYSSLDEPLTLFYLIAMGKALPAVREYINLDEVAANLVKYMKQENACWLMDHPDTPNVCEVLLSLAGRRGDAERKEIVKLVQWLNPQYRPKVVNSRTKPVRESRGSTQCEKSAALKKQKIKREDSSKPGSAKGELADRSPAPYPAAQAPSSDLTPEQYLNSIQSKEKTFESAYCEERIATCLEQGGLDETMKWLKVSADCQSVNRPDQVVEALHQALKKVPVQLPWVIYLINETSKVQLPSDDKISAVLELCENLLLQQSQVPDVQTDSVEYLYQFLKRHKCQPFQKMDVCTLSSVMNTSWKCTEIPSDLVEFVEQQDLSRFQTHHQYKQLCYHIVRYYRRQSPANNDKALSWVFAMEPGRASQKNGADKTLVKMLQHELTLPGPDVEWIVLLFTKVVQPQKVCQLTPKMIAGVAKILPDNLSPDSSLCKSGVAGYLADSLAESLEKKKVEIDGSCDIAHVHGYCRSDKSRIRLIQQVLKCGKPPKEVDVVTGLCKELLASGDVDTIMLALERLETLIWQHPAKIIETIATLQSRPKKVKNKWESLYEWCLAQEERAKNPEQAVTQLTVEVQSACDQLKDATDIIPEAKWILRQLVVRAQVHSRNFSDNYINWLNALEDTENAFLVRKALKMQDSGTPVPNQLRQKLQEMKSSVIGLFSQEQQERITALVMPRPELEESITVLTTSGPGDNDEVEPVLSSEPDRVAAVVETKSSSPLPPPSLVEPMEESSDFPVQEPAVQEPAVQEPKGDREQLQSDDSLKESAESAADLSETSPSEWKVDKNKPAGLPMGKDALSIWGHKDLPDEFSQAWFGSRESAGASAATVSQEFEVETGIAALDNLILNTELPVDTDQLEKEYKWLIKLAQAQFGSKRSEAIQGHFQILLLYRTIITHAAMEQYHLVIQSIGELANICQGCFLALPPRIQSGLISTLELYIGKLNTEDHPQTLPTFTTLLRHMYLYQRLDRLNERVKNSPDENTENELCHLLKEWKDSKNGPFKIDYFCHKAQTLIEYEQARKTPKKWKEFAKKVESPEFSRMPVQHYKEAQEFVAPLLETDIPQEMKPYLFMLKLCSSIQWIDERKLSVNYSDQDRSESTAFLMKIRVFNCKIPDSLHPLLISLIHALDEIQLKSVDHNVNRIMGNIQRGLRQAINDKLPIEKKVMVPQSPVGLPF